LRARGPRAVLVTSLHTAQTPQDAVDMLACDPSGRFLVRTPLLPATVNGAGDAAAALFFFHYLRCGDLAEALSRTASSIFGIVRRTAQAGARELVLIEAQEELVAPSQVFRPEPV
jgi:pyridoxine kinase